MKTRRTWKVYGAEGHRQRESFSPSHALEDCTGGKVEILNADKTGTNDYTVIAISAETAEECERILWGQLSDGVFENSAVGKVTEVKSSGKEVTLFSHWLSEY